MVKLISLLTTLALILTTFAACSSADDSGADETTAAPTTTAAETEAETEPAYELGVPDELDYNGYTFRFLGCPGENKTTESYFLQFTYDQEDGDIFNDSLYKRNEYVKEYLNIELETQTHGTLTDIGAFRKSVRAQDDSFDCGIWIDRFALGAAQEDMVYPLHEMAKMYVDLDAPWWLTNVNDALSIDNKLYFGAGAYDLSIYGSTQMLLFNKNLAADLQLADMYDLVRTGKWTTDAMYENMKLATADLNGDSKQDKDDRWGFNYIGNFCDFAMMSGNGAYYILKDEDDLPYFAASGNERLIQISDVLVHMLKDEAYAIQHDDMATQYKNGHPYENVVSMFADSKSLYVGAGAMYMGNLRNMEDDFGILPFPKLEEYEAGTEFSSWLFGVLGYIVPTTISDPEMASAVLEMIAYSSYEMVVPSYLETVLQLKSTRDDDSAEMLKMLTKSSNYCIDLAHTYFLDSTNPVYGAAHNDGPEKIASTIEKNMTKIEKQLQKTIEKFQELN